MLWSGIQDYLVVVKDLSRSYDLDLTHLQIYSDGCRRTFSFSLTIWVVPLFPGCPHDREAGFPREMDTKEKEQETEPL